MNEYALHILADCEDCNLKNLERSVSKMEMWLEVHYKFSSYNKVLLTLKPREDEVTLWKQRSVLDFYQYASTIVVSSLLKHNH